MDRNRTGALYQIRGIILQKTKIDSREVVKPLEPYHKEVYKYLIQGGMDIEIGLRTREFDQRKRQKVVQDS